MKNFLSQLGKAICYFLLFVGTQSLVISAYMFVCGIQLGVESAVSGAELDADAMAVAMTEDVYSNLNLILIIAGCLTILLLWIVFRCRKKKLLAETGIRTFSIKYVPVIALLGIGLAAVVTFVLGMLPEEMLEAYAEESQYITGSDTGITLTVILSNMIIAPVVEELIFRGLILSRLKRAVPVVWAVVISSAIFGLAHGQIIWMAYAFVLGVVLSVVAIRTESVAAAILLHAVFNVFGTVIPTVCEDCSTAVMGAIAAVGAVAMVISLYIIVKQSFHEKTDNATVVTE